MKELAMRRGKDFSISARDVCWVHKQLMKICLRSANYLEYRHIFSMRIEMFSQILFIQLTAALDRNTSNNNIYFYHLSPLLNNFLQYKFQSNMVTLIFFEEN